MMDDTTPRPTPWWRRWWMIIIWIVLALFVLLIIIAGLSGEETGTASAPGPTVLAPAMVPAATAAPVTPSPTPVAPTATARPQPITTAGQGSEVRDLILPRGVYTAEISVSDNTDCSFGSCLEDNFAVELQSVDGEGYELLANEIVDTWTGAATFRVGPGILDLTPGNHVMTVDASGDWSITITRK